MNCYVREQSGYGQLSRCDKAFDHSKEALVNCQVLAHYDPEKPIRFVCDASPYGVGIVISQLEINVQEKLIAFSSRSGYTQIEREALAIIFGVKNFTSTFTVKCSLFKQTINR